jgi:pectate lyase
MIRLLILFSFGFTIQSTGIALSEPVFPGAVGFGVDTRAGKGGHIIRVTNLDASGPGSFRNALETKGPRIVVFEVGGVIDLAQKSVSIREPFLTIAGQTAPSPGVTLIKGGLSIQAHDILIQHIRIRPGDAGQPKKSGWEPDGITSSGANAFNIVIDHCSVTWAVDENLSVSGPRTEGPDATTRRMTISNCIIAEGLHDSSHAKGPHSKGSLIHDFCRDIAIIGNLYAHNVQRNPYFKAHTTGVIANNLIYNPGNAAIQVGYVPNEWKDVPLEPANCRLSVVGNILFHGQDTWSKLTMVGRLGDVYNEDNRAFTSKGEPAPILHSQVTVLTEKPIWPDSYTPLPSSQVVDSVIKNAGARPGERDAIDQRIIDDFIQRKGRVIHSQNDVGGYPELAVTHRSLTIPENVQSWLEEMSDAVE